MADTFRVERAVSIGAIIMFVLILISFLSFTGVLKIGDKFRSSYCKVPKPFECENLRVSPEAFQFKLINTGKDLKEIIIKPESKECKETTFPGAKQGGSADVIINCVPLTAPKGRKFTQKFSIFYSTELQLNPDEVKGSIKGIVE